MSSILLFLATNILTYKSMILISIQSTMQSSITKLNQSKASISTCLFSIIHFHENGWLEGNQTKASKLVIQANSANSTALRNKSGFGLMKLRVFSWTGNQAVEIWRFLEVLFAHCIFSIPRSFLCREMRDGGWNTMLNKIYRMWHKQCCGEWRPNWSHNKVSTSGPGSIMRQGLCVKTKQPEPPPAYVAANICKIPALFFAGFCHLSRYRQ